MPSIKSFLSDHETKVDLLNNEAIASTIVDLLKEKPDRPVTVGVHGDWGAGKSSILEMIEVALKDDPKALCLKFNGWRFQGFEDAKIALIEGIVNGLVESQPRSAKIKAKAKQVIKSIDWLKVAKKGGGLAFTAFTGVPSPNLIQSAVAAATNALGNPAETKEGVDKAVEGLQSLLKKSDSPSTSVPKKVSEFHKAFGELLKAAGIEQLIVLIDDLDRCLPDTAIETLEAIRLFVFTPKTAFVVAADEVMIEYSVSKHFPDLPRSSGPQAYARNYLEKLIQIPFRIPPLGEGETRIYVALALAEATLGEESEEFRRLLGYAREVLTRPWLGCVLEDARIQQALGTGTPDAAELIALSDRIGPILARGTSGNPRQVKRFLNSMLLRERTAKARGFGSDVQLPTLAKLLLAERFSPGFFDELVVEASSDPNGKSSLLASLEAATGSPPSPMGSSNSTLSPEAQRWSQDDWVASWVGIEPLLAATDLRPYAFIANQQARMSMGTALGPLIQTVNALMGTRMAVAILDDEINRLTLPEAKSVMRELMSRIRTADLRNQPDGVNGLRALVKAQPELQVDIVDFLRLLPVDELGPWAPAGWRETLSAQKDALRGVLAAWASQSVNAPLRSAASSILPTL